MGPGPNDGRDDNFDVKIENSITAYMDQIAWDAELLGYSPLANDPGKPVGRLRRKLRHIAAMFAAANSPIDPYALF